MNYRTIIAPLLTSVLVAQTAKVDTPAQVRTVTPSAAVNNQAYSIPGRTEAFEDTTIFTRATGIVKDRRFDIGDQVKAGDIMTTIEIPEIDRAIESANASIDQTMARADNARLLSERANGLLEAKAISKEESDQRRADAVETDAAVRVARAELARLEELRGFATVRAPFDGIISARNFNRGDRVRGDSASVDEWLFRLVSLTQIRFVIAAPPDLALQLNDKSTASVRFGEFPGRAFTAKFSRKSAVFDEASGTMRIELLIDNADLALPSGLTGTASFTLAPDAGSFLVPTNTIILRRGQASVASVQNGKVAMLPIALGRNYGASVEARSAELTAATQVIINPNAMLRAGDSVEIIAPETPSN